MSKVNYLKEYPNIASEKEAVIAFILKIKENNNFKYCSLNEAFQTLVRGRSQILKTLADTNAQLYFELMLECPSLIASHDLVNKVLTKVQRTQIYESYLLQKDDNFECELIPENYW
jgi:hypothetical protein